MTDPVQRYALLGWPVKHSVSPQMQEAGFRALGIPATYELLEIPPADIPNCMEQLVLNGYRGWNVTVPHKEQVARLLKTLDAEAAAAGSVNTVVNENGRLYGYSTDGYGLAQAIAEEFDIDVKGNGFLFMGTGGAARAAAVYLARHGAREVVLVNRTLEKAEALAETIHAAAPQCALRVVSLADTHVITTSLAHIDVLIQSTSLGLHADDPLPLAPDLVPDSVCVMDMIYGCTPFRMALGKRGIRTADGRGMLLHQGVKSFELWTGRTAPLEVMRTALTTALAVR